MRWHFITTSGDNIKNLKVIFYLFIVILVVSLLCLFVISERNLSLFGQKILNVQGVDRCYANSYNQADDLIGDFDSTFINLNICDNPFAQLIFFIKFFSRFPPDAKGELSIAEILSNRKSNRLSNTIAITALMQRMGWDIKIFYNKEECYLGINFNKDWKIRKGIWIELNGRKYYLKEMDTSTPVGEIKIDNPASRYQSPKSKMLNLKPVPLMRRLPQFSGKSIKRRLQWKFHDTGYKLDIEIPVKQIEFTENLPACLYGTVASGIKELKNIGLDDKLRFLLEEFDEYEKVNFLLKFCQSENIFTYHSGQQIRSISQQLIDGSNDCDGRSVFLYSLLVAVLKYSSTDIVFLSWPNHLTLGLRPKTKEAEKILERLGHYVGDKYYILDSAYAGATHWGSKMRKLSNKCKIISLK